MNTEQATAKAFKILEQADTRMLTEADAAELEKLEPFIPEEQFGDIWSGYLTASEALTATK